MPETTTPDAGHWRTDDAWPDVDVVMPIRNEAAHLPSAVASVRGQVYPGRVRIVLAVGPSVDATEDVAAALAETSPDVDVVANPTGSTPAGLNAAIAAGSAPVIVRVDGHSELPSGYIEVAVDTLRRTGAANVGGLQVPNPTTRFEQAVATATTSWMGTGGASYRVGGRAGPVDTVYLGVFDRAAIESVGLFDEGLIRNQDYELNIRLRSAGHLVWFDPALAVGYRPRGSWAALARQYFEYGRWKSVVMRRYPSSVRVRQIIPPAAIVAVVAGPLVSRRRGWMLPLGYAIACLSTARGRVLAAGALVVIHVMWTAGVLAGAVAGVPAAAHRNR